MLINIEGKVIETKNILIIDSIYEIDDYESIPGWKFEVRFLNNKHEGFYRPFA